MEGETFPVLLKLHKVYNAFHPKAQRALLSLSNEFLVSRCRKTPSLLGILLLNGDPWERGVRGDMVEGKGRHNKTRDERDIWENAAVKKED